MARSPTLPFDADSAAPPRRSKIAAHIAIARFDHWFKNVFVLPGVVAALAFAPNRLGLGLLVETVVGLLAVGLVCSSNYVLNELVDAPFDRLHPTKRYRPAPAGEIHKGLAYVQWIVLMLAGVGLGALASAPLAVVLGALWLMGCLYNIPGVRTKDLPYVDVLSESVNNPLRMLVGWYIVGPDAIAPASLLMSYWMVGCYFMAMKRFAEYREIGSSERAAAYRASFAYYTEARLLVSVMFYASSSMLFLGTFIMRYQMSLIVSVPFIAFVMALYLHLGLRPGSPVQNPETLYRERLLVVSLIVTAAVMTVFAFYDFPLLIRIFSPTAPTGVPAP